MGILNRLVARLKPASSCRKPCIIPREQHNISRKDISEACLKVLYRLHNAGFQAYLVGGSVRDLLLGRTPKDFDVVTDAHPDKVRDVFRNSRLIGRRFKLVHVFYDNEIIEVSTFRSTESEQGIGMHDNQYGTLEEDVWRRDFTVNALYYNIADYSVVDYVGGMQDLQKRTIRVIGNPEKRFEEDPIRLLRAIRLSAKLDFAISPDIETCFQSMRSFIQKVSPARVFDELLKIFFMGHSHVTYHALMQYDYMSLFFPQLVKTLNQPHSDEGAHFIEKCLLASDQRFSDNLPINPGFLFAVFLWPTLQERLKKHPMYKKRFFYALHSCVGDVLQKQVQTLKIPKRFTAMMRDIWLLQYHLKRKRGRRVYRTFSHRYYRAGIDFMALRVANGESQQDLVDWWRTFEVATASEREKMCGSLDPT
ncbi:MAG TPA: polynucleotide adenylyltransferase PcnB [Coxiellaceae bacterium]|nr:polynucleotide adenylyltransferase PcnB [Coxiellaceae bacterium]